MISGQRSSLLSLPPEVRLQIYGQLLTPVKDNTCRAIYITRKGSRSKSAKRLKGFQMDCSLCCDEISHTTCLPSTNLATPIEVRTFVTLSGGRIHTSILRVCRSVFQEALPVLHRHLRMCISVLSDASQRHDTDSDETLKLFLSYLRLPRGSLLPTVSLRISPIFFQVGDRNENSDKGLFEKAFRGLECFQSTCKIINDAGIKVGHLDIDTSPCPAIKAQNVHYLVYSLAGLLLALDQKPSTINWNHQSKSLDQFSAIDSDIAKFNEAANRWLSEGAKATYIHEGSQRIFLHKMVSRCSNKHQIVARISSKRIR